MSFLNEEKTLKHSEGSRRKLLENTMTLHMDNEDYICYLVTKHSKWKGKYKRILSFGSNGVTTYDPDSLELTNRWPYADICSIKRTPLEHRFTITGKKAGANKIETMSFSTEHRAELLSLAFEYRSHFSEKFHDVMRYEAQKYHWSGTRLPVILEVSVGCLKQLDTATHGALASYLYKDIDYLADLSDIPQGFLVVMKNFGRMHLFISPGKNEIKNKIVENASTHMGLDVRVLTTQVPLQHFLENKFGMFSDDEHTTSLVEFIVEKTQSDRHTDSTQRLLCLSQSCLLERDPETYSIVTLRPLRSIFSFVRDPVNSRNFIIEYKDFESSNTRSYSCTHRDSVLATLMDGVRSSGNKDVHVKMKLTSRGKRFCPFYSCSEEEVEAMHLRFLKNLAGKKGMMDMVERFNCNVPYSGLLHSVTQDGLFKENKEKLILEALQAISLVKTSDFESMCEEELEGLYHAIRRLVASKSGFSSFTQIPGFRESLGGIVLCGIKRNSEALTGAALDMICCLMHPMHDEPDIKQEQLNKSSLLSSLSFLSALLEKWTYHVSNDSGALIVSATLDFLTFALCAPYSETTEGRHFDSLLEMVAKRARSLFKQFQHPCTTIVKGASLVMQAIIEEGDAEIASKMKELALNEGALPRHLISSFFTSKTEMKRLTQCKLSRHLTALWLANNVNGMKLMERILPSGLLNYLESCEKAPLTEEAAADGIRDNLRLAQDHASKNQLNPQLVTLEKKIRVIEKQFEDTLVHWGTRLGYEKRSDRLRTAPVVLRKSRQRVKSNLNWELFYYNFNKDHSLPNLIWNHKTRSELKIALEKEVRAFESDREVSRGSPIAWNYAEFTVDYPSLREQLCIDGYYIRLLLDRESAPQSLQNISENFFFNLYHRFLLSSSSSVKSMCLHALAIVYSHFHEKIGYFADTKYIISMLQMTYDRTERDKLLLFLHKLTYNKENVRDIIDSDGVPVLVDLLTLAHLHTSRAVIPTQSNVIEFRSDAKGNDDEKEWHYQIKLPSKDKNEKTTAEIQASFKELKELFSKGIINKESKVWAQGMQNWAAVSQVTQLKWCLLGRGSPLMNETDLAVLILNMLITMIGNYPSRNEDGAIIWPICKLRQILSSPGCLPHIVQLLLTFDPVIVEKVATLLSEIARDNPHTPKLYMTGVFYFILMYNGSNLLPIAKFLQLTHSKQAFRGDEAQSMELMQRSILGQLLPEAMVNVLEYHGDEKFAQIFLGEFDTPEVIWNSEMRIMMIQKIAAHIGDFSPRLWSNNKALYQHAIIPAIRYPQLTNELFCNIFYLKHLSDTSRFPDWPISDPVTVLRDVLEAWKLEVEKKPPPMSVDEAYQILELPPGQHHHESLLRKAYYKLAQKYHPDKNLDGRVKFEAVNKAYDFLCSRKVWMETGVNVNNIILIIKTQSILFSRYSSVLQPYKYAGYPQLIKTIQLEMEDDQLFSKQYILLPSAVELIFHTVNCSVLNAEEFNRSRGFEVIGCALSRCVSTLSGGSEVGAQVCLFSTRIFTIAASFQSIRLTFHQIPTFLPDLIRILHFKDLVRLCCAVVECISALSVEPGLVRKLTELGVLWYLVPFLFLYDYTLEESGIQSSQENNQQEAWNELAKLSCKACTYMSGLLAENGPSSENEIIKSILTVLLTNHVIELMKEEDKNVLKFLNSNCETPYFVWNNITRTELLEFLEDTKKTWQSGQDVKEFMSFKYSSHKDELIIGNIFVRIYNDQPSFPLKNPKEFVADLLEFIKNFKSDSSSKTKSKIDCLIMALTSLHHVIHQNLGVELQCIGSFNVLFALLKPENDIEIKVIILKIISLVTRNQECVSDIASANILIYLLLTLPTLPEYHEVTLECIFGLISSSAIVKELIIRGGILYLLNILLNSNQISIKTKAAEVLGRLINDKVSGPRIKLAISQALPPIVCDVMRDTPQAAVNFLETYQENPEIIWTEQDKSQISSLVAEFTNKQYEAQREDPETSALIPDFSSINSRNSKEIVIGGVYLNLFNRSPGWNLHRPAFFLTELLDAFVKQSTKTKREEMGSSGGGEGEPLSTELRTVGEALSNLLAWQPHLLDQLPATGLLSRLFTHWPVVSLELSQITFTLLTHIFTSQSCVDSLRQVDCLLPMKQALARHPQLLDLGCQVLANLFHFSHETLIKQALETGLVSFLVGLLEGNLPAAENSARTKAIIAKTLKTMSESSAHGSAITSILEKSPIWASYSEQKLDLFITNSTSPAYLTGTPGSSGYLTQGPVQTLPSAPPPLNKD